MTLRIHHTVAKQAAKFGLKLNIEGGHIVAYQGTGIVATGVNASSVLAAALNATGQTTKQIMSKLRKPKAKKAKKARRQSDDGEEGDDDGEDEEAEGKSIVKPKYRAAYKPHKSTCGDALTRQIREEFHNGHELDWAKFVKFAKANDVWSTNYATLNHGLARMSTVNRLRAKIRRKEEITWNV